MAEIFDILRFEGDSSQDLTMTEVYQEVANVSLLGAELGTYVFDMSMVHTFDSVTTSVYRRMSIDGGATWNEFVVEPSDITDLIPDSYNFFVEGASGNLTLQIETRKETSAGVLLVKQVHASIRRVK